MSQTSAAEKLFIQKAKEHIATIERYSGSDPLDPWYRYLAWLETNCDIDFRDDSLFMRILSRCLAKFESEKRYKQDRRLIKLFIKYISYQSDPEEHYDVMYSNGVGHLVTDLYICWAYWFNIVGEYDRAEEIYQLGIKAKARSASLLKDAHEKFGANMSQRILNKSNPKYEQKKRTMIQEGHKVFIRLDIVPGYLMQEPNEMRFNLNEFDRPEEYAIPFDRTESAQPTTPQRQLGTSVLQKIVNSCSARKKPLESRHSLHPSKVSRLDFGKEESASTPLVNYDNMYERGIQLPRKFVRTNEPQRVTVVPPVRDDELSSDDTDVLKLPTYDKIMLMPATDKSYSPEELLAYKWYKGQNVTNEFTANMDAVWSVGSHVPLRRGEWLAKQNMPQRDEVQESDFFIDGPIAGGIWRFAFDVELHHPTDSTEEFSREELLRQKRIKSSSVGVRLPSSILQTIKRRKSEFPQIRSTDQVESTPRPTKSRQSAKHIECRSIDMSAELKNNDDGPPLADGKTTRLEILEDDSPDAKKNRKMSAEFNDTMCTTQLFGLSLKRQAVSTPITKMDQTRTANVSPSIIPEITVTPPIPEVNEKFDIFVDESMAHAPEAKAEKVNQEAPAGNLKFDIFTDESVNQMVALNLNGSPNTMDVETKPEAAGFDFEIYRDETKVMSEVIKLNAEKQLAQVMAAPPAEPVNDENRPLEFLQGPTQGKLNRSTMNSTEQLLKETNVTMGVPANHPQISELNNSFAIVPTSEPINDENRPLKISMSPTQHKLHRSTLHSTEQPLKEKNVTMGVPASQQQIADIDFSFAISDVEKGLIATNPKKINFSYDYEESNEPRMIAKQSSIDEEDSEENDLLGQSIYVPRDEVIFSNAKHADWMEVTLHLAEGDAAKNDYVAEAVDMNQTLQVIDAHLLDLMKLSPFEPKLQKALLDSVSFIDQLATMSRDVCDMVKIVQPMKPKAKLSVGTRTFNIQKLIGSGNFGHVFCGECCRTKSLLAFKQERPPNIWEFYICLEVHKRLQDQRIRNGCMSIEYALIGNNATIFASKFSPYGTLLNVCNKVKTSTDRNMDEYVVMIFAKQMFAIVDALHRVNIIHGDIKPDNFLLMNLLDYDYDAAEMALQLIDFGQSIDMKLFPRKQVFYSKVKTKNFVCTEMMDNRPWTYQLDLFCLASTIFTMVCGEYMVVRKVSKNSTTYTTRPIPRYYCRKLWTGIFDALINIPDPQRMPSLTELSRRLDAEIQAVGAKAMRQKITEFNKALVK